MGAIIEMSDATRPWFAELRSESFYLNVHGEGVPRLAARLDKPYDRDPNFGSFTVPAELVPALRAALAEVSDYERTRVEQPVDDPWTVTAAPAGGITIAGPAYLYGFKFLDGAIEDDIAELEFSYEHLQHLRAALDQRAGATP